MTAKTLDELISNLDSHRTTGYEIPFLRYGETAFDRISSHLLCSSNMPRRVIENGLYILFALMEVCPSRAANLLELAMHVSQTTMDDQLKGIASITSIRVALIAKEPCVDVPRALLNQLRVQLLSTLESEIANTDRDYIAAFLNRPEFRDESFENGHN